MYFNTFAPFLILAEILVNFFGDFFNLLFTDVWSIISLELNPYSSWLIKFLDFTQADLFLSQLYLVYLLFSLTIITIVILKFLK